MGKGKKKRVPQKLNIEAKKAEEESEDGDAFPALGAPATPAATPAATTTTAELQKGEISTFDEFPCCNQWFDV